MKLLPPPGPQRTRQFVLLGAFVLLLVVSRWYNASPESPTAAAPSTAPTARPGAVPTTLPSPIALGKLDALSDEPTAVRNPFGFGVKPAPPPPPPPTPLPAPPPPPPAPPPPPPGPPPITLKLVGILTHPTTGRPMVTLKDPNGNALFQATEGAVVDGKYKIIKINVQSVVISYLDGSGQRTIALGG